MKGKKRKVNGIIGLLVWVMKWLIFVIKTKIWNFLKFMIVKKDEMFSFYNKNQDIELSRTKDVIGSFKGKSTPKFVFQN